MQANRAHPGLFVTFEGGEGSGKSTQFAQTAAFLIADGIPVTATREPGGTEIGTAIRSFLLDAKNTTLVPTAELLLYEACRAQVTEEIIRPALAQAHVVLCDRFFDSTTAYQGYARGLDLAMVQRLNLAATSGLRPDCTLWFDMEPAAGIARARARSGAAALDRLEREALAFHERVRNGYRAIALAEPERVIRIDASRSIEVIQAEIQAILRQQIAWRATHAMDKVA